MFSNLKTELKMIIQTKLAMLVSGLMGGFVASDGINVPNFFTQLRSFFGF